MIKILISIGTRPEAIKMAPLIKELTINKKFKLSLCLTGQHKEMLYQVLNFFDIKPNFDLNLMKPNQDLAQLTSKVLTNFTAVLDQVKPDIVLVHGDTTTCFASSLAAFYKQIPIGHVEAGLRTGEMNSPFPEEANRVLAGTLANIHFCPTKNAKDNLKIENKDNEKIYVTGNTVIDALLMTKNIIHNDNKILSKMKNKFKMLDANKKIILVTGHRRENFGQGFLKICRAINKIASTEQNVQIIYPVHLNPNVKNIVHQNIKKRENVFLISPLSYEEFIFLMDKSYLILTDSGGIQEEAPTLGKPVLVMRDNSERPEAIAANTAKLVGTDADTIVNSVASLLQDTELYSSMSNAHNPYGNGKAAQKIITILENVYGR